MNLPNVFANFHLLATVLFEILSSSLLSRMNFHNFSANFYIFAHIFLGVILFSKFTLKLKLFTKFLEKKTFFMKKIRENSSANSLFSFSA
jgi:hypothetical protein